MVQFCMQNEFSAVFCFLSTCRWIKPLFCSKITVSLPDVTNTRLRQQRMCRQKNFIFNVLRVDVASAVREVSQKSQWIANLFAPGSINCGTTFLQICPPTVFGERALLLHIFKLPERPSQGLSSIPPPKNTLFRCTYGVDKDDFCIMQIFRWVPSLFEHKVHQNIICTSYMRYCIHIKKKI